MFHDNQRVNAEDKFFVCGGNPDKSGGGVIASSNSYDYALSIQLDAIKQGYVNVRIHTWKELTERERESKND